jgi:hypothetical protein
MEDITACIQQMIAPPTAEKRRQSAELISLTEEVIAVVFSQVASFERLLANFAGIIAFRKRTMPV